MHMSVRACASPGAGVIGVVAPRWWVLGIELRSSRRTELALTD